LHGGNSDERARPTPTLAGKPAFGQVITFGHSEEFDRQQMFDDNAQNSLVFGPVAANNMNSW
jgi:hypothetical protein